MSDYDVFPEQRQLFIQTLLEEKGRVVCADIAKQLNVSEHTIRRDLQELARNGLCKKVYGGAVSLIPEAGNFVTRVAQNISEKQIIARRCIEFIKEGSCIFIDAGTTNLAVAQMLPENKMLTVVTNCPVIASSLLPLSECEVILVGGRVSKTTGGILGAMAINQIRDISFDQAFIGACAIDPDAGITAFDFDDASFKKEVIRQSSQVVIALTADKVPSVARYKFASCEEVDLLVVNDEANTSSFTHLNLRIEAAC